MGFFNPSSAPNNYLGTWNASTNSPTLASSVGPSSPGSYYVVSVAGTTTLNGISDWTVGDWVIWSGSVWQKLEGGATTVTVATTNVVGGTANGVLWNNGGVLGGGPITTTSAGVTAIPSGGSLSINGATIGSNALAVTGTALVSSNFQVGTLAGMIFQGSTKLYADGGDGTLTLYNNAATGFTRLMFGGTTSSFPAIKRNAAAINFRLADDSADAAITAASLALGGATIGTDALAVTGTASVSTSISTPLHTAPAGNLTIQSASNSNVIINAAGSAVLALRANSTSSLEIDSSQNVYQRNGSFLYYGATTNSGDTYTLTPARAVTTLPTGAAFYAQINSTNTTTTPTMNISGLGATTIVKRASTALAAGDLVANGFYLFIKQATNLQVLNPTVP